VRVERPSSTAVQDAAMSELIRLGRQIRALRRRRRLRQVDLAALVGLAQTTISLVERGHGDRLSVRTLARIGGALDARLTIGISWRAGDLDRLLDARHTDLSAAVAAILRAYGWEVVAEVTFAIGAERGSVDLLAWHAPTATLLVVEIKTELASGERMLRTLDTKVRHAPGLARRFGWRPRTVGRLVVLPESSTNRRHARSLATLVGPRATADGWAIRRWLRDPASTLDGLWILSLSNGGGDGRLHGGAHRVRVAAAGPSGPAASPGERGRNGRRTSPPGRRPADPGSSTTVAG
jgi:transcriptional regulator with XRE-family HTH domain